MTSFDLIKSLFSRMSNISEEEVQNYIGALMQCYGVAIDEDAARFQLSLQTNKNAENETRAESSMRLADERFLRDQGMYLVNCLRSNDMKNILSIKDEIFKFVKQYFENSYRHTFDEWFGQDRQIRVYRTYKSVNYVIDYVTDRITGQGVIYLTFYDDKIPRSVYKTNP